MAFERYALSKALISACDSGTMVAEIEREGLDDDLHQTDQEGAGDLF